MQVLLPSASFFLPEAALLMDISAVIILLFEGLFALALLYRDGLLKRPAPFVVSALLVALAMGLRLIVFDYETGDYRNFLTVWVDFFREHGGFAALSQPVGNYNIPYLYFLALFSYFDIKDLYLIKLLSVFFDIVLAWSAMKLVGLVTGSPRRALAVFFVTLFLPTVFLNGALWGQCDSCYAALALLGIYLALTDRPILSMVCAALSFGFKLQAVFILPVYAVVWMMGKFRWKHFLIFPLSYVLLVLPAVIAGRPFADTILLYLGQTGSIGTGLNYNSSSIFALLTVTWDQTRAGNLGILAAFLFMFAVLGLCFFRRRYINGRAVAAASLLLSAGIPFLLPHMHERYFFGADALSLVLAFVDPMFAAAALLMQFASLLGYHAYLKMRYLMPMSRGAWAVLLVMALALWSLCAQLFRSEQHKRKNLS